MAYNNISGSVLLPEQLLKVEGISSGIVSGNLSTSDGASVINVPRVSNATNNSILTNVGGDANDLTCETNLTFDGSALNVTGMVTASVGISASYLYGDGSRLVNLPGGGSGAGIFTEINADKAFTTSSIQVGSEATPNHRLSIAGSTFLNGALVHKRTTVTGDYLISTTDYYVCANTSGGALKLTLPQASTTTSGQTFIIKDEGGVANTNPITVSGSSSDQIDGENTIVLESPYAAISIYCDGVSKYFVY